MYLETGVDEKKIKIYNDQYKIVTETPTSKKKNSQYIHNGKGTAIIGKKNIKT